jgi:hypothetical protein
MKPTTWSHSVPKDGVTISNEGNSHAYSSRRNSHAYSSRSYCFSSTYRLVATGCSAPHFRGVILFPAFSGGVVVPLSLVCYLAALGNWRSR